jgi:hypothetical protein
MASIETTWTRRRKDFIQKNLRLNELTHMIKVPQYQTRNIEETELLGYLICMQLHHVYYLTSRFRNPDCYRPIALTGNSDNH